MKKVTITFLFIFLFFSSKAQDFSYGVLLGTNVYELSASGELGNKSGITAINFGVFGDQKINENFGLKLNIFYGKSVEQGFVFENDFFTGKININKLNSQLLFKYDANQSYNEGFYLLGGPRLTFVTGAKKRSDGSDFSDLYNSTNIGLSAGFGSEFSNHFAFEFMFDYGFASTIDIADNRSTTTGAYLKVLINVESLIND